MCILCVYFIHRLTAFRILELNETKSDEENQNERKHDFLLFIQIMLLLVRTTKKTHSAYTVLHTSGVSLCVCVNVHKNRCSIVIRHFKRPRERTPFSRCTHFCRFRQQQTNISSQCSGTGPNLATLHFSFMLELCVVLSLCTYIHLHCELHAYMIGELTVWCTVHPALISIARMRSVGIIHIWRMSFVVAATESVRLANGRPLHP